MPIEDIDFLGENSEVDSTLFFLDSDSRDRLAFPTPAEYVIQFTEPIKLVIGVDILDATIPAAMYIIDAHSHSFIVTTLGCPDDLGGGAQAQGLLSTAILKSERLALAMVHAQTTTVYCFLVDAVDGAAAAAASRRSTDTETETDTGTDTNCPCSCAFMIVVRPTTGTDTDAWSTYAFRSAHEMDALPSTVSRVLTVRKAALILQHGNYDIVSLMQILATSLKDVALSGLTGADASFATFDVVSPSSGTVSLQGRYAFVNEEAPFLMDMRPSPTSVATVLGFSSAAAVLAAKSGIGYNAVGDSGFGFGSVRSSTIAPTTLSNPAYAVAPVNMVVAPDVANLLGVRYITLRCPEIEQHLYSGMTYCSHSTGLGVFKLPSGSEVSNLRFDFVSLVRRPFHPIGRLSRLTLRFERSDGVLYDFKGINTQLLLAVKFLSPGKRVPLKRSVLNPDYDPDFLRYTLRMTATQAVEATDSNRQGLLPLVPSRPLPFESHDHDDIYEAGEEHGREGGGGGGGDEADQGAVFKRRQEIARVLLQSQDKYDYPPSQSDDQAWRAV